MRFGHSLPKPERQDWEVLAKKLREWFPDTDPEDNVQIAISKLAELRQGDQDLQAYIDKAQELAYTIPADFETTASKSSVQGDVTPHSLHYSYSFRI